MWIQKWIILRGRKALLFHFQRILAVKCRIEKFQFYPTGHKFLVEMDMSAFPKMLSFKQKQIPISQLLRWAKWFSKFYFDVKHIKWKINLLLDLLTRPKFSHIQSIPIICMMSPPYSLLSQNESIPLEFNSLTKDKTLYSRAKKLMFKYQSIVIKRRKKKGIETLGGLGFHQDYPFSLCLI